MLRLVILFQLKMGFTNQIWLQVFILFSTYKQVDNFTHDQPFFSWDNKEYTVLFLANYMSLLKIQQKLFSIYKENP